jgi:hypothetical protein
MTEEIKRIENPLIVCYEQPDASVMTLIHTTEKCNRYELFGLLVCDIVRHVAAAFKVSEDDVWEWVDKERYRHTTDITRPS